jgi:DNA-binding transcriptional MerR regulator
MEEPELTKKYYRIREVSDMLEVPISTLRFWEQAIPQLKPTRNAKGTRYYSPADIDILRQIKFLLHTRGLKIEAAIEQMRTAPDTVAARQHALDRLQYIRACLVKMRDSLRQRHGTGN